MVADNSSQALQTYMQETGYKALLARWESQKEKIVDLGKRLATDESVDHWRLRSRLVMDVDHLAWVC